MKKLANVLGCIAATLLSIVLILSVQIFALRNAAAAFTKPSTITQVIQKIDIQELIPDTEELKDLLLLPESESNGEIEELDAVLDSINALLKSHAVEELLDLYVKDILATVTQNNPEKLLNAEAVKAIAENNIDELVAIIKPYIPEEEMPDDEELKTQVLTFVDDFSKEIVAFLPVLTESSNSMTLNELLSGTGAVGESLPDLTDVEGTAVISVDAQRFETQRATTGSSDETTPDSEPTGSKSWGELDGFSAVLRFLLDPMVTVSFIILLVVLAVLIYGCRFPRFGGLLWLGIDGLIAAVLTGILAALVNGSFLYSLIPEEAAAIITAVTGVLASSLTVTAIVCAVIGVVFIVGFVLLRKFVCNHQPLPVDAPIVETVTVAEKISTESVAEDVSE